ncbi:MAG: dethiobiotin synthase [Legionella sp.]
MRRYFITGTDTDCGKTYVTKALLDYLPSACAIKPVASGCSVIDGQLVNADAQVLKQYTDLSLNEINPWRFEPAIAPHIAAQRAESVIHLEALASFCLEFESQATDILLIEGAGGLMVPLNEEHTWLDLLQLTKLPVILVVGMKLGCINHALLTERVLQAHQIKCHGWIANCLNPEMAALDENIHSLRSMLAAPLLAVIRANGGVDAVTSPL